MVKHFLLLLLSLFASIENRFSGEVLRSLSAVFEDGGADCPTIQAADDQSELFDPMVIDAHASDR